MKLINFRFKPWLHFFRDLFAPAHELQLPCLYQQLLLVNEIIVLKQFLNQNNCSRAAEARNISHKKYIFGEIFTRINLSCLKVSQLGDILLRITICIISNLIVVQFIEYSICKELLERGQQLELASYLQRPNYQEFILT